jgi:hypothetical protein
MEYAEIHAIHARIREIDAVLFAEENFTSNTILFADSERLTREREVQFAALSREREELAARLPRTGMAGGFRLTISKVLGDLRDWPEPKPDVGDAGGPVDEWAWMNDEENTSNLRQG